MGSAGERIVAGPQAHAYLKDVFTPGTRLGTRQDEPDATPTAVVVTGVEEVAAVRMPTGRLVVDSPWPPDEWEAQIPRELAERIPPGTYRVDLAWVEAPYEFMDEHFDGRECAAARLVVSEEPVVEWEVAAALRDPATVTSYDDRLGFGTDTSTGCFADASAWHALTEPFRKFWEKDEDGNLLGNERDTEDLAEGIERSSDEALGADLVTIPANEGDTTVWLGRTASGATAVVAVAPRLAALTHGPYAEMD